MIISQLSPLFPPLTLRSFRHLRPGPHRGLRRGLAHALALGAADHRHGAPTKRREGRKFPEFFVDFSGFSGDFQGIFRGFEWISVFFRGFEWILVNTSWFFVDFQG